MTAASHRDGEAERRGGVRVLAPVALVAGGLAIIAMAAGLWASEGAAVFLTQAFAALAACF